MVEIGTSTLIGIAVTIFFSLLSIGVAFLYRISVNLHGIESNIQRMNDNLGSKLETIEENTRESTRLLHRISERTRNRGFAEGEEDDKGNENTGTDGGVDTKSSSDAEIVEPEETEEDSPTPDTDHIEDDLPWEENEDIEWEYIIHALNRIEELEGTSITNPENIPEDKVSNISEKPNESGDPGQDDFEEHWVTEEAEDISFALSHEIGGKELYLSVAVGNEVTQINYHIGEAGFPGLVGADPKQNKITRKLQSNAEDKFGENTVLSVHSGQVVVSIPTTNFEEIKGWIERSTNIIENIVNSNSNDEENGESKKKGVN